MGLHSKAIQAVMLLILELMDRGYRVALSTHSPAVLEVVWALQELKANNASVSAVRKIFGLDSSRWDIGELAKHSLRKTYRVFYMDYDGDRVISRDISNLDPGSPNLSEASWGELTSLSARVNAVVADAQGGAA